MYLKEFWFDIASIVKGKNIYLPKCSFNIESLAVLLWSRLQQYKIAEMKLLAQKRELQVGYNSRSWFSLLLFWECAGNCFCLVVLRQRSQISRSVWLFWSLWYRNRGLGRSSFFTLFSVFLYYCGDFWASSEDHVWIHWTCIKNLLLPLFLFTHTVLITHSNPWITCHETSIFWTKILIRLG